MKIKISITPPVHWFRLPQTIFSTNSGLQGSFRNLEYAAGKHKPEAKWVFWFYFIFLFQHVAANENMAAQSGAAERERAVAQEESSVYHQASHHLPWHAIFTWHKTDSQNITTTLTQRAQKRKKKRKRLIFILFPFFNPHNCMTGKQGACQNLF